MVDELLTDDPNDVGAWKTRADAYRALGRTADLQYLAAGDPPARPEPRARPARTVPAPPPGGREGGGVRCAPPAARGRRGRRDPTPRSSCRPATSPPSWDAGRRRTARTSARRQLDPPSRGDRDPRARLRLAAGRPDLALEVLDQTLAASARSERPVGTLLLRARDPHGPRTAGRGAIRLPAGPPKTSRARRARSRVSADVCSTRASTPTRSRS